MADYVLAIDQGTTGSTVLVIDKDGAVAGRGYSEFTQHYPQPGWVEHDAAEIWTVTSKVIGAALGDAGIKATEVAAIGITNQRETTVVWDRKTGEPIHNAIVWQCRRTADFCDELKERGLADSVRDKTGLVIDAYFSGTKVKWILDHVDGARARAAAGELCFGTIDSWLIYKLSGGKAHVTDYTNASRTMIFNIESRDWDDELLQIMDVPRAMLPEILPSSAKDAYGYTLDGGPVGARVPVCGDLGDQQAALFGQACYAVGEGKNTYGTGCFCLLNTGSAIVHSQSGLLTTVAYSLEPGRATYALEGSVAITGAAVQWLRDNLGLIENAAETEAIAASVSDTGGCYFVPAFSGLFAPYWDMNARGVIVGLTRYVNRAHLVRATLESICYQTRDVMEAMVTDAASVGSAAGGGMELATLKVDGGASVNNFLMQLQADVLGVPVVRPTISETTALGAAYAAGLAVGLWSGLDDLRANWDVDRRFTPQWNVARRAAGVAGWKKAIERTRGWVES